MNYYTYTYRVGNQWRDMPVYERTFGNLPAALRWADVQEHGVVITINWTLKSWY